MIQVRIALLSLALFIFLTLDGLAQKTQKAINSRYKEISSLSLDSIRLPKYAYLAEEFTAEQFVPYYFKHGKGNSSKDLGYHFIDSLYRDSIYTYYLFRTSFYPVNLLRVQSNDIEKFHISKIDGPKLRQLFIDEIIPQKDKEKVRKRGSNCGMGLESMDFKYVFDKEKGRVLFTYKWKITCDFIRVINSEYCAFYSLEDDTFYR